MRLEVWGRGDSGNEKPSYFETRICRCAPQYEGFFATVPRAQAKAPLYFLLLPSPQIVVRTAQLPLLFGSSLQFCSALEIAPAISDLKAV